MKLCRPESVEIEVQKASQLERKDLCSLEEFAKILDVKSTDSTLKELFQLYIKVTC